MSDAQGARGLMCAASPSAAVFQSLNCDPFCAVSVAPADARTTATTPPRQEGEPFRRASRHDFRIRTSQKTVDAGCASALGFIPPPLPADTRKVFLVLADVFNQLGVRQKVEAYVHRPWLRVGLRVVHGELEIEMPEVAAPEALRRAQCVGVRQAAVVHPGLVVEPHGIDDERIS